MNNPFIISESRAAAIKARWWRMAKFELMYWAIFTGLGYWMFEPLIRHWSAWTVFAVFGSSLLLFSRLAIWVALFLGGVAYLGFGFLGIPCPLAFYTLNAVFLAIIVRCPVFLFFFLCLAGAAGSAVHGASLTSDEPLALYYDPRTDENVYPNGRRVRAYRESDLPPERSIYEVQAEIQDEEERRRHW
jgi:hypothetical protein